MDEKHLELLIRIDERTAATADKVDGLVTGQKLQNGRLADHDSWISEHKECHTGIDKEKHHERLSALEKWRWYVVGIVTGLIFIGGILLKYKII